jgi:hypothetical protein
MIEVHGRGAFKASADARLVVINLSLDTPGPEQELQGFDYFHETNLFRSFGKLGTSWCAAITHQAEL